MKKTWKQLAAGFLAAAMLASVLPVSAFAEENEPVEVMQPQVVEQATPEQSAPEQTAYDKAVETFATLPNAADLTDDNRADFEAAAAAAQEAYDAMSEDEQAKFDEEYVDLLEKALALNDTLTESAATYTSTYQFSNLKVGMIVHAGDILGLANHTSCYRKAYIRWDYKSGSYDYYQPKCNETFTVPDNTGTCNAWEIIALGNKGNTATPCCMIEIKETTFKTDSDKVTESKTLVTDAIDSITATNSTTADSLLSAARSAITDQDVSAAWKSAPVITQATKRTEGSITGTIVLSCGTEKQEVPVNKKIEKLPMTDAEKVEYGKELAETELGNYSASNSSTEDAILTILNNTVKTSGATASWDTFQKEDATDDLDGSITGTINITCGTEVQPVPVSLTISCLKTDAQKVETAKAKAEVAIAGITATNATTAEDILAVVNKAISSKTRSNNSVVAVWGTDDGEAFAKNPATNTSNGSITGKIILTCGTETTKIDVNYTLLYPSISLGSQSITIIAGVGGDVTFAIATAGFTPSDNYTVEWDGTHSGITADVSGNTVTATVTAAANAGEYKFKVVSGETESNEVTLTIGKATYPASLDKTVNIVNGPSKNGTLTLSDLFGGTVPTGARYKGWTPIKAGNVLKVTNVTALDTVSYTSKQLATGTKASDIFKAVISSTNYNDIPVIITFTSVDKVRATITGVSVADRAYNGNAITYTGTPAAKVNGSAVTIPATDYTYTWSKANGDQLAAAPKDAGDYKLTVTVADTNASYTGEQVIDFTISQAEITVSGITASDKPYDALLGAVVDCQNATLTGKVGTEDLYVTAGGEFADKNVGTAKTVNILDLTLNGTALANYKLAASGQQATTTAAITPATLTIADAVATGKVYDGKTDIAVTGGTLVGVLGGYARISGDVVNLVTTNAKGNTADVNVGTAKAVTVTGYTITGADAGNYTLTQPTGLTADITNATLTGVSAAQKGTLTYNGTAQTAEVTTAATAVNGQSVTFTYSTSQNGSYTPTVPGFTRAAGYTVYYKANAANHSEATGSFIVRIDKKTLAWDASGLKAEKVFDGSNTATVTGTLKVSGTAGSDDIGFTYTGITGKYEKATDGEWTVTATVAGDAITNKNYVLPTDKIFTFKGKITPKPELPTPPEADPGELLKLEVEQGITKVPDALENNSELNSTDKIANKMKAEVQKNLAGSTVQIRDITLWFSEDNGTTWSQATADKFPSCGYITVEIPFAELGITAQQAKTLNFTVSHMISAGSQAGTVEFPTYEVTDTSLRFKLTSLSPVAVGYKTLSLVTLNANGGTCDVAAVYAARNNKVTAFPTATRSGYTFDGWFTAAEGGNKVDTNTEFAADATVYAHWTQNSSGGGSTPTPTPTPDTTPGKFTVNAWVNVLAGGTVSPMGTTTYTQGVNKTYTITPATGYRIAKVTVDGVDVGAVSSYTFNYMNRNHEIGAYFEKITTATGVSKVPATGDESPILLWVVLMAVAAAGLCGTFVLRRKKHN